MSAGTRERAEDFADPADRLPLARVRDLVRTFGSGPTEAKALRGVSFDIPRAALIAVRGRSGAGKTTLLNIVGGLDRPTSGTVHLDGDDITAMTDGERRALRRTRISFVFQTFGLLPFLSAAENVGVPLRIAGVPRREREERVRLMLELTGLGEHAAQRPSELSGGQQQRVAIARALTGRPKLLIADEPTAQLDHETARRIMGLLNTVVRSEGVSALVATHDRTLLDLADKVLSLRDGQVALSA